MTEPTREEKLAALHAVEHALKQIRDELHGELVGPPIEYASTHPIDGEWIDNKLAEIAAERERLEAAQ